MIKEQTRIISELQKPNLPDYKFLSSETSLKAYEETLECLLEKAKKTFNDILKLSETKITFANVVEKYLNMDEELNTLYSFLHHLDGTSSSEMTRRIIERFQPKMVEYGNMVSLSTEYYLLLKKLDMQDRKNKKLSSEQSRSLFLLNRNMEISGVHLKGKKKKRLEEIALRLSELSQKFSNNVLDSRKKFFFKFETNEYLREMPKADLQTAREEAKKRKLSGWVFTLSPPSFHGIMLYCSGREIRKKFWQKNVQIATTGKFDNRPLVLEILNLRKEKASLLGFQTFAEYALQSRMAKSPDEVIKLLSKFSGKAKGKAKKEYEELREFSGLKKMNNWDTAYFSEKLKKKQFSIDEKKLREFFPLSQVLHGLFQTAERLFGLSFKKTYSPTYNSDVLCYEVYSGKKLISYFLLDLFARPEKRGGAWCNDLRCQRKGKVPVVVNVGNFTGGTKAQPPLLTHGDVQTMFHEFGHGLHVMLSKNTYANTSGFHTEWDFVELPSQLLENWTWKKEGLHLFAKHFRTKKELPEKMIHALSESRKFLKGIFMLRQNEFGFLDFLLHSSAPPKSVEALDKKILAISNKYSIIKKPPYYRMYASFSHIFSGGYAAGYYSYLWAEVLEADVFSRFQQEGILNPKIGKEYAKCILYEGAKKDGAELFRDFMGREPSPEALLKKLGL